MYSWIFGIGQDYTGNAPGPPNRGGRCWRNGLSHYDDVLLAGAVDADDQDQLDVRGLARAGDEDLVSGRVGKWRRNHVTPYYNSIYAELPAATADHSFFGNDSSGCGIWFLDIL